MQVDGAYYYQDMLQAFTAAAASHQEQPYPFPCTSNSALVMLACVNASI